MLLTIYLLFVMTKVSILSLLYKFKTPSHEWKTWEKRTKCTWKQNVLLLFAVSETWTPRSGFLFEVLNSIFVNNHNIAFPNIWFEVSLKTFPCVKWIVRLSVFFSIIFHLSPALIDWHFPHFQIEKLSIIFQCTHWCAKKVIFNAQNLQKRWMCRIR